MSFNPDTNTPFDTASPFGSGNPFAADNDVMGFAPQVPADGCTQCGMCLPTCPTFTMSEDPQQSPMGRIRLMRALKEGEVEGEAVEALEGCLGCYSCETVCPSRVEFGRWLDDSLARVREQRPLPTITRLMLFLAEKRTVLNRLVQAVWLAQAIGLRGVLNSLGLNRLLGLQRANTLLGRLDYPVALRTRSRRGKNSRSVALFTGCFSSVMEQRVQQATIDVLSALGLSVTLPEGQGCCGALHRHNGEPGKAARLARRNIDAFATELADAVVTTSSGCGAALKAYDAWLEGDALTTPVWDLSHYLADLLGKRQVVFERLPLRVAVHTPCTLRQGEGQAEAVVELLGKIPGLEIVPLPSSPRCCGAGGSQVLSRPQMADALRDETVEAIRATAADVVVSSNLGCAMHLRAGLVEAGVEIPLQHPVQLIARAMVVEYSTARRGDASPLPSPQ